MKITNWVVVVSCLIALIGNFSRPGAEADAANSNLEYLGTMTDFQNFQPSLSGAVDLAPPGGLLTGAAFGKGVWVLPNGNLVVSDPAWNGNRGALYLYNGITHAVISVLLGNTAGDQVAAGGVVILSSGDFVVLSPSWNNNKGAVTWCSQTSGCVENPLDLPHLPVVSAANSLVGSQANDRVGINGVVLLSGGGYVVSSSFWANSTSPNAGAVTRCPSTGCFGPVSTSNSLYGGGTGDQVGLLGGVIPLPNGGYVVKNLVWGGNKGAVTYCPAAGCHAVVSSANSLVGALNGDYIGDVTVLKNGGYVVYSPTFSRLAAGFVGSVTPCETPGTGCTGVISSSNSLVGSSPSDQIGSAGVVPLTGGAFAVLSPFWTDTLAGSAGAVTICNSANAYCVSGAISNSNSLVGTHTADRVGANGATILAGGGLVVNSPFWNGNLGAVTVCPAANCAGIVISPANSLIGSSPNDQVGMASYALPGGGFVVKSHLWDSNKGAVTVCPAAGCVNMQISSANSLVGVRVFPGTYAGDQIGSGGIAVMSSGQFLVSSPNWSDTSADRRGAVTLCPSSGCTGTVLSANSLVGSLANDRVGWSVQSLAGGGYLVGSPTWSYSQAVAQVGAVTRCLPSGCTGPVSSSNSLVGAAANDQVGGGLIALPWGGFMVFSPAWDKGATVDAGAVSLCTSYCTGVIYSGNSVEGKTTGSGGGMNAVYDSVNNQLVVGRPTDNLVTFFTIPLAPSQTSITSNLSIATNPGQSYPVAVQVRSNGGLPSGTVDISDGTSSCQAQLANGIGACNLTSTTLGNKTITAKYNADAHFSGSTTQASHKVATSTVTSITSNLTTATFIGQSYPVSVSVTANAGTPTGTVGVSDGTSNCQIQLAGGTGSCNLTSLHPGSLTISAVYAGDTTFAGSQAQVGHTVRYASFLPLTRK